MSEATTTTTTENTTTTAAPAPAPAAPWHGVAEAAAFKDVGVEDAHAYIKNKGWSDAAGPIRSYIGAEKLIGRDPTTLLSIPRADDPAGFLAAMDRLGRPASADKYEFAKPDEGQALDTGYEKWARDVFHKVGMPASMVKSLTGEHNAYIKGVLEQQTKDYNLSVDADKKALLSKWGAGHERMMSVATSAAKALGFSGEMMDAIERTVGYGKTMEFMADLGKRMSEDGFVTPNNGGGGGGNGNLMTPDEAKAEYTRLQSDPNFVKMLADKMHPGNAAAQKKQSALFAIMYPEG